MIKLRYPIYVPSKARADKFLTAKMFLKDGVDFKAVVEPQDAQAYANVVGAEKILTLPENDRGLVYARNWIKAHSVFNGDLRHWQFDDDIEYMMRINRGYKTICSSLAAIAIVEDFVDRYENVALASFNSEFFCPVAKGMTHLKIPPIYINARCYTVFLVLNEIPNCWRFRYNEDTDMTLQVLVDGWCTVLFNAFTIRTPTTMSYSGGQTSIYVNDGRLRMARQLERVWPGVVKTVRKFKRPQHDVKGHWTKFDTPLKYKPDFDPTQENPNKYGLILNAIKPIKSDGLKQYFIDMNK